jgi:predicted O-linked N-acetylglucosamine transferase (SPINDLY family)
MATSSSRLKSKRETSDQSLQRARLLIVEGEPYAALGIVSSLDPSDRDSASAFQVTAMAWARAGNPARAISSLKSALRQCPDNLRWWLDLAKLQCASSLHKESHESFSRASALRELDSQSLKLWARSARLAGEYGVCIEVLEQLLDREPHHHDLRAELAQLYSTCDFHHDALQHRLALAAQRADPSAWIELSRAQMQAGQTPEAIKSGLAALDAVDNAQFASEHLIMRVHDENQTPASLRSAHEAWTRKYITRTPPNPNWENTNDPDRRIRIGYVCGEGPGAPSYYFLLPLLNQRDRTLFHVTWYHTTPEQSGRARHYAEEADCFRDVSNLDHVAVAQQIRSDNIDLLVDLSGHYESSQLQIFSMGAAPVQIAFPNYPGTTGLSDIRYLLTDKYVCPPGSEAQYTEHAVRVDPGYLAYAVPPAPAVTPSPRHSNGFVTFGIFQRPAKFNPGLWDAVARLLVGTPDSSLLIHYAARELDEENSLAQQALGHQLQTRGIGDNRIQFVGRRSAFEHLNVISRVDIALDTFPYNGQTTTCECLLMGVPVVSRAGSYHVARVARSILERTGCGQLVANSWAEYTTIAANLATDAESLDEYRKALRDRLLKSSLVDGTAVAGVEVAYRAIWKDWCQQRPQPKAIDAFTKTKFTRESAT